MYRSKSHRVGVDAFCVESDVSFYFVILASYINESINISQL